MLLIINLTTYLGDLRFATLRWVGTKNHTAIFFQMVGGTTVINPMVVMGKLKKPRKSKTQKCVGTLGLAISAKNPCEPSMDHHPPTKKLQTSLGWSVQPIHGAFGSDVFFRCWFGSFFSGDLMFFLGGRGILKWKMRLNISIPLVSIFFLAILNIHYDTSTNPSHSYVPSENILGSTKRPYQGTWLVATTGCSSLWGLSSYKLVD